MLHWNNLEPLRLDSDVSKCISRKIYDLSFRALEGFLLNPRFFFRNLNTLIHIVDPFCRGLAYPGGVKVALSISFP